MTFGENLIVKSELQSFELPNSSMAELIKESLERIATNKPDKVALVSFSKSSKAVAVS